MSSGYDQLLTAKDAAALLLFELLPHGVKGGLLSWLASMVSPECAFIGLGGNLSACCRYVVEVWVQPFRGTQRGSTGGVRTP